VNTKELMDALLKGPACAVAMLDYADDVNEPWDVLFVANVGYSPDAVMAALSKVTKQSLGREDNFTGNVYVLVAFDCSMNLLACEEVDKANVEQWEVWS
jgi:hypothetical protein